MPYLISNYFPITITTVFLDYKILCCTCTNCIYKRITSIYTLNPLVAEKYLVYQSLSEVMNIQTANGCLFSLILDAIGQPRNWKHLSLTPHSTINYTTQR
jgi:hypothetical protein